MDVMALLTRLRDASSTYDSGDFETLDLYESNENTLLIFSRVFLCTLSRWCSIRKNFHGIISESTIQSSG